METLIKNRFNIICDKTILWCIYAVIFAAPFSKSISEIAISLAIILWITGKMINRDPRLVRTEMNLPFLLFVLTIVPSFLNSEFMNLSVRAFFTKILKFIVFYFVIVEKIDNKAKLKDLFIVALLSVVVITLDGFTQYYYAWSDGLHNYPSFKFRYAHESMGFFRGFPTACFPFPNDLAAWILLVIFPIVCVTVFGLHKKRIRYFIATVALGLFYLFFLTKARGAWVGLVVSTLYIALSKRKLWMVLLLILIVAVPFILKMEMSEYIFNFGSIGDRFSMWGTAGQIFKNHPVIGNGLNTFFVNFKKYRTDEWKDKKGSYAHNCYLQMACDVGLIGLGAFLWLMYAYFVSIVKALKKIKDAFFGSILWGMSIGIFAFLIHSFFDTNLYSLNLVTLFWTAIGVSQVIIKVSEREPA